MVKVFGQIDSGELAARLGSINTFDRRGNILWMDGFEAGTVNWSVGTTAGRGSCTLSTDRFVSGSQSAKLVTGNVQDDLVRIQRDLTYPSVGKLGFEIASTTDADIQTLKLWLHVMDGAKQHVAEITYDETDDSLYYRNSGGTYTKLTSVHPIYGYVYLFHTFKLVADFENDEYMRFMLNGETYDMTGIKMYNRSYVSAKLLSAYYTITTNVDDTVTCYVDNAIITINES